MRNLIIFAFLAISLLTVSCATIVSGSKQNVRFSSNPTAATIFIDEVEVGKTPFEIKLARISEHSVMIKLEGYQTYETKLTKKFNDWYLGNILIGGIIGLIVDPMTGAMYNLSPDQVDAQKNKGLTFRENGDNLYFAVSLTIDPSWNKVGQLDKTGSN